MKKVGTILKFELGNYFGSKSYVLSTILLCLACVLIMFFPRIKDAFTSDDKDDDKNKKEYYAIYDPENIIDEAELSELLGSKVERMDSLEKLKAVVEDLDSEEKALGGYDIKSIDSYDYYVYNKGVFDAGNAVLDEYLKSMQKVAYCESHNLDLEEFMNMEYSELNSNEIILGKDGTSNYWYCYILVILVFMVIIMYGVTIATGVANEKSNRSIEILVTSASSSHILFGKVIAGTIAAFFQIGLIAGGLLGSYQMNKEYWGDNISTFLNIPGNVLFTFAVFGIGGFLFYAFLYGALGALVSKIEDLNKSAGTAQMVVMIVYFAVLSQLSNIDGMVMKVLSYLPISSYSAMFARVAMGEVSAVEIVISAIVLYASVIGMGFVGGKIFRNSTLRYGNPIKLTAAIKDLTKKN